MIPATVSASYAFMVPVATPPNAIAFSYGYIKVYNMVRNYIPMYVYRDVSNCIARDSVHSMGSVMNCLFIEDLIVTGFYRCLHEHSMCWNCDLCP